MNERIVESLIHEGYKGHHIAMMEKCHHKFQSIMVFKDNDVEGEFVHTVHCVNCGCDTYAAEIMGLNPENYCEPAVDYV